MSPLDLWYTMMPVDPCTGRCSMSCMSYSSQDHVLCPTRILLYTGRTCRKERILCHMSHIRLLLCTEYASTLEAISYVLCPMPPEFTSVAQIRASTQECVPCIMSLDSDFYYVPACTMHRRGTQEGVLCPVSLHSTEEREPGVYNMYYVCAEYTAEGHRRVSYVPCPSPLAIPHSGLTTGLTRSRRSPSSR